MSNKPVTHTPEPWNTNEDVTGDIFISGADSTWVAEIGCPDDECAKHDARRIVACVNACAGIKTEYLEDAYKTCQEASLDSAVVSLTAQRYELLSALKKSLDSMAAIIVDLADLQGVKITKKSVIEKSTNDSPVGVILAAIAKAEAQS